jgi:hypothetical protein
MAFKTERFHVGGQEKVAAVQDQRANHGVANALPDLICRSVAAKSDSPFSSSGTPMQRKKTSARGRLCSRRRFKRFGALE